MASPGGLTTCTAPRRSRVDGALRLVPPALRFRRPDLAVAAILTDELTVLIPEQGAVGVVGRVLGHVGRDHPLRHLGHHVFVELFSAEAGVPKARRPGLPLGPPLVSGNSAPL